MVKIRLIPVLLLQSGSLVRSERFNFHQIIGDPYHEVIRFNEWEVDELIYLDITVPGQRDTHVRFDTRHKRQPSKYDVLKQVAKNCFMPLTWGGGLRSIGDIQRTLAGGADKVTLGAAAVENPSLITEASRRFGAQAVVTVIDAKRCNDTGTYQTFINNGSLNTQIHPVELAKRVEDLGSGEILIQSIDRDGTGDGYDLELINNVCRNVNIPVIALGGVGSYDHYAEAVKAGASAVASANIWHFKDLADRGGKRALRAAGIDIREEIGGFE
mgnify:CR=1 FL=1